MFKMFGFDVDGVFEGDDGLLSFTRSDGTLPTEDDFKEMGMMLKMKPVNNLSDAEFCGMYAHEDVLDNVSDPVYQMAKFGWSMAAQKGGGPRVIRGLLRAKALSLAYEMPRCPIVREMAEYAIRMTEGTQAIYDTNRYGMKNWKDSQIPINHRLDSRVDRRTRLFVEERFGVSVTLQLKYEHYFKNCNTIQAIPVFDGLPIPRPWRENWERFVRDVPSHMTNNLIMW